MFLVTGFDRRASRTPAPSGIKNAAESDGELRAVDHSGTEKSITSQKAQVLVH
jgi:hypothetical protein